MDNEIQRIVGVGLGIAGVIGAAHVFSGRLKTVERQGLGVVSGLLLVLAAATLLTRFENSVEDARRLLA